MGQEIARAKTANLPALNLTDPSSILLLPEWLRRSLAGVSPSGDGRIIRDANGTKIGEVPTLPSSRMLTGSMREAVTRRVTELEAALLPGPSDDLGELLAILFTRYGSSRGDEDATAVRTDSYLDAVFDLPAWAVREAMRRWRRGQCGVALREYDFAPSEARLRRISEGISKVAEGQAIALRRLLSAEEEITLTDEQRAEQSAEFSRLADGIRERTAELSRQQRQERRTTGEHAALTADLQARAARRAAAAEPDGDKPAPAESETSSDGEGQP